MEVKHGKAPSVPVGWHSRGYLPHLDAGHVVQFVTFRLADSVPAELVRRWREELEATRNSTDLSTALIRRVERFADAGHGACHLRDPQVAWTVQSALRHFDGCHYDLLAWCIMPNHVHVLLRMTTPDRPLGGIVHSWKSFTAKQINQYLGRQGALWQRDYFDRYIRDQPHLEASVEYIRQNPVKAGLVEVAEHWPWTGVTDAVEGMLQT